MKQCRMDTPVEPEYDKEEAEYDGGVVNCHSALDAESRKTTNSLLLDTGIKYQYDKNELYRYDKNELCRYDIFSLSFYGERSETGESIETGRMRKLRPNNQT